MMKLINLQILGSWKQININSTVFIITSENFNKNILFVTSFEITLEFSALFIPTRSNNKIDFKYNRI